MGASTSTPSASSDMSAATRAGGDSLVPLRAARNRAARRRAPGSALTHCPRSLTRSDAESRSIWTSVSSNGSSSTIISQLTSASWSRPRRRPESTVSVPGSEATTRTAVRTRVHARGNSTSTPRPRNVSTPSSTNSTTSSVGISRSTPPFSGIARPSGGHERIDLSTTSRTASSTTEGSGSSAYGRSESVPVRTSTSSLHRTAPTGSSPESEAAPPRSSS